MTESISAAAPEPATRRDSTFLWIYTPLLIALQAVYAYSYTRSTYLPNALVGPLFIRLSLWTLPVVIYLACTGRDVPDDLGLKRNIGRGVTWGVSLGCLIVALTLLAAWMMTGHARVNLHLPLRLWISAVATVGLSEEVVFRGFLLARLGERTRFAIANLAQAALFLAIHIPGWILLHEFVFPAIVQTALYVLGLGLFLGWVRKTSGSLWGCMIIHSFSNFASLAIK